MGWWGAEPFNRFVGYIHEIHQVLCMSVQGLSYISKMVPLAEALADLDKCPETDEGTTNHDLERTRLNAEFAQRELERDFPLLHAHSVVAIWSALEALVEDVLVAFLLNDPTIRQSNSVKKIKLSFGDYDALDDEGKAYYLAHEIQNNMNLDLKRGISKFDSIFQFIGIIVEVDEDLRRTFYEMGCLRNAIVHRAAVADRKLSMECPWLNIDPGHKIEISHADYMKYFNSTEKYIVAIIKKLNSLPVREKDRMNSTA